MATKNDFIYITTPNGIDYDVRARLSSNEYQQDLETMRNVGQRLLTCFVVPFELGGVILQTCTQFVEGKLSFDDLHPRVEELIDAYLK